ncbi:MAG: bacteriohemerythrin [Rhodocyclaceae bacterium]|nr:bacteriohemerythrin [Rhodocyclaceae bacterium]
MALMEWSKDLELGIAEIDAQHRWLVNATNELHEELGKGAPSQSEVSALLAGLATYTINHFVTEELLFERYGYPQAEAHHKEHRHFVRAVKEWEQRHSAGEPLGKEILTFLKEWLRYHILKTDRAYVPFLKQRGVC